MSRLGDGNSCMSYTMTYSLTDADAECIDNGCIGPGGWRFSMAELSPAGMPPPEPLGSVEEAVELLRHHGCFEGGGGGSVTPSYYQTTATVDYRTGHSETVAIHLIGFTVEECAEIARAVGGE